MPALGTQGYRLLSTRERGHAVTEIEANSDVGVLYGTFVFLRLIQTGRDIAHLDVIDAPRLPLRMLDHWDNLDGTVERGYSGRSLWNWAELPRVSQRMIDYARANASVGINGVVLNNVNADARILTSDYLKKVAALADAWRPYGIRLFLTARFSAPIEIGGLKTADPLDPRVRQWWQAKADEIYRLIPDFGGFLVKANSEGQPGPHDYGRTHADGANMMADALRPHGGTVIWRAFVYSRSNEDRAKQAYDEFRPLDGKFAQNVVVQVKNGPIDFQPREPFHPLFGQMPRTRVALEAQITREYIGQNSGIAYLAPMWSEVLGADTCSPRCGTPVWRTIAAIAGVANVGSDRNWTGTNFDQANWYAFGRLAWNPAMSPRDIADEWTRMTWSNDARVVRPVVQMMMNSREAVVNYMTPLGLAHQMGTDHHYGPAPWVSDLKRAEYNPAYYNRADATGIGFDRTRTGSNAVSQYAAPVARCYSDLKCIPDKYLLWFHHVPWTYRMRTGRTLWGELIGQYDDGVATVAAMNRTWASLTPFIDAQRHAGVAADLGEQLVEARWWRNASIAYWQSLSKLPLPRGHAAPPHPLSWYEAIHFDTVPGFLAPRSKFCRFTKGEAPCVH
jgi:alpha-glucuronidase